MQYLHPDYLKIQRTYAPGLLEFPDEFLPEYFKESKRAAGFVKITDDGTTVTSCVWDEEAYQKWCDENPEQPELEPEVSDHDVLNALLGVME